MKRRVVFGGLAILVLFVVWLALIMLTTPTWSLAFAGDAVVAGEVRAKAAWAFALVVGPTSLAVFIDATVLGLPFLHQKGDPQWSRTPLGPAGLFVAVLFAWPWALPLYVLQREGLKRRIAATREARAAIAAGTGPRRDF
jgi:hypothetical protein